MLITYYRSVFYGLSRIRTCKAVRQPIYSRFEIANSQSTRYKIPPGTVCRAGGIYPFSRWHFIAGALVGASDTRVIPLRSASGECDSQDFSHRS
jgi:hypothetical protein